MCSLWGSAAQAGTIGLHIESWVFLVLFCLWQHTITIRRLPIHITTRLIHMFTRDVWRHWTHSREMRWKTFISF